MSLDKLEEMYRDEMPGYDLVGKYEAGIPTYKLRLKVNAQRRQELPVIPRFVLGLIGLGIYSENEIAAALGVEFEFVRKALIYLNSNQLIIYKFNSPHIVTDKGKQAIEEAISAMHVAYFDIQVDGLTRGITSLSRLEHGPTLKKMGGWSLHPSSNARPTLESLNSRLTDLEKIFKEQWEDEEINSNDQLIEILDIERSTLMYKLVDVLLFRERKTQQVYFRVFEGYNEISEYNQILKRRDSSGSPVIPDNLLVSAADAVQSEVVQKMRLNLERVQQVNQQIQEAEFEKKILQASLDSVDNEVKQPEIITAKTKQIQELEAQVNGLKESSKGYKIIRNSEHRTILKEAISSAQKQVIIISFQIREYATDKEIIGLIKQAIQRDVQVLIGYGMPPRKGETKDNYIDEAVDKEFKKIQKGINGDKLNVKWLGDTHEKILICDNRFGVLTSFNWLSYRGNQGFRKETGTYFENPEMIKNLINDVLNRFNPKRTTI